MSDQVELSDQLEMAEPSPSRFVLKPIVLGDDDPVLADEGPVLADRDRPSMFMLCLLWLIRMIWGHTKFEKDKRVAKAEPATGVAHNMEADPVVGEFTSEPATGADEEYTGQRVVTKPAAKKRKTHRAGKKTREKKEEAAARKAALEQANEEGGRQQATWKHVQRNSNCHVVEEMNGSAELEIAASGIETATHSPGGVNGADTQDDEDDMRTRRELSDDSTVADESAHASSETSLSDEEPRIDKAFGGDSTAEDESLQHPIFPPLDIPSNSPKKIEARSQDQDGLLVVDVSTATPEASLVVPAIPPTRQAPRITPVIPLSRKLAAVAQTIPLTTNVPPVPATTNVSLVVTPTAKESRVVQSPPTTSNTSPSMATRTETQEEPQAVYVAKKEGPTKSNTLVPRAADVPPQLELPRRTQELNEVDWPHLEVHSSLFKTRTITASPVVRSDPAMINTSPVPSAVVITSQVDPPKPTQELDEVEQPVVRAESPPTTIKSSSEPLAVDVPPQVEQRNQTQNLDEVEQPVVRIKLRSTTIESSSVPLADVLQSQVEPSRSMEEQYEVEWPRLGA